MNAIAIRDQLSVDNIWELSLETADCFALRLSVGSSALKVGASAWLEVSLNHCDRVKSAVQPPITAAVEAVALDRAGWSRHRCGPIEGSKAALRGDAPPVAHIGKDASNHQRPDADDLDQTCPAFHHQAPDVDIEISDLWTETAKAGQPTNQKSRFNRSFGLKKGLDAPQRPSADQVSDLSLVAGGTPRALATARRPFQQAVKG
jgi:hypothetical protein